MSPLAQWIVVAGLGCAAVGLLWLLAQAERSARWPRWDPAAEDVRAPAIEETRLMPERDWREEDVVPEGVGVVRPPARLAAQFPRLNVHQLTAVARRRVQEHTA